MSSISNWTQFHSPGEPLKNFVRSEPFDVKTKDTYVGGTKKPKKKDRKTYYEALKARWEK